MGRPYAGGPFFVLAVRSIEVSECENITARVQIRYAEKESIVNSPYRSTQESITICQRDAASPTQNVSQRDPEQIGHGQSNGHI